MRTPHLSVVPVAMLFAFTGSCGRFDPETQAHQEYVRQLQPLLVENALLAEQVLELAAEVYDTPDIAPSTLVTTWTTNLVPLADHLHIQATFVAPPEPWQEQHEVLVEIWSDRAHAYRSLGESIRTGDAEAWRSARTLVDGVKLREEEWFRSANQVLAPRGLVVDQFP